MRIAVTGGTGFVGSHLCNVLNGRGHSVTAISLDPENAAFPLDNGIDTKEGNVLDKDSFSLEGYDTVIHLVGLSPLFEPQNISYEEIHVEGTKNVLELAEESNINNFVHMSALGADPKSKVDYLKTKGIAEDIVGDSALNYTIVRPSVLFGEGGEFLDLIKSVAEKSPIFPLANYGRTRFQPIYIGDMVKILADIAEGHNEEDKIVEVGGPEVLTLRDIVSGVYRSLDKKPVFAPVPNILSLVGLSIANLIPFAPVGLDQYRSLKLDNVVEENDASKFGFSDNRDFVSVSEYLSK